MAGSKPPPKSTLSAAEVWAEHDLSRRGYPGLLRRWPAAAFEAASGGAGRRPWPAVAAGPLPHFYAPHSD